MNVRKKITGKKAGRQGSWRKWDKSYQYAYKCVKFSKKKFDNKNKEC